MEEASGAARAALVSVEASAPGKLILFGEHSVVYGAQAVAGAVSDLRIYVRVTLRPAADPRRPALVIGLPVLDSGRPSSEADRAADAAAAASSSLPPLVRQAVVPLAFLVVTALGDVVGLPSADPAVAAAAKTVPGTAQDDEDFDEEDDVDADPDADVEGGPQPTGAAARTLGAAAAAPAPGSAGRTAGPAAPCFQPLDVELELTRSTLPVGSGLGSSAALAVAAAGALLTARAHLECVRRGASPGQLAALRARSGAAATAAAPCGDSDSGSAAEECGPAALPPVPGPWLPGSGCTVSLHAVNAWALAAETLFHGTPSGLDNTVATFGGLLRFRKFPAEMKPVVLGGPEAAARGEALPPELDVVIINTHAPKNTKALVAGVRTLKDAQPDVVGPILTAMDGIAKAAVESLEAGSQGGGSRDFGLGRLASANHNLLCAIGVGHPALDAVVSDARDHGLSAKLTGAGGGGCAFALVPPTGHDGSDVDSFEATSARRGFSWFRTRVGGAGGGARVEE
ncbi:hypothetical protein FNF31_04798 [Cafeteria roenbergensis]|uniref:mevalonate kinase n=1 Tax=Cafeteria roenbergensis TaxID=33653 RepID=A0A5A8D3R1_CAFRO|nr:hypothetical protein FNF31_04798 [Cafeteria roenbergensis]